VIVPPTWDFQATKTIDNRDIYLILSLLIMRLISYAAGRVLNSCMASALTVTRCSSNTWVGLEGM
jgi:hypothetical protein